MASEITRTDSNSVADGAIAPSPGRGRTPRKGKKAEEVNLSVPPLDLPVLDTTQAAEDYQALQVDTIAQLKAQAKETAVTIDQVATAVENGTAQVIVNRINQSGLRIAQAVNRQAGGAAVDHKSFRESAIADADDFIADLLSSISAG